MVGQSYASKELFGERKGRQLEERVVRSELGLGGLFGEREGILLTGRVGKSELG